MQRKGGGGQEVNGGSGTASFRAMGLPFRGEHFFPGLLVIIGGRQGEMLGTLHAFRNLLAG